jgi:hypothetical protein
MPDSDRQRRAEELYSAALKHDAGARDEFLRQARGKDTELRRVVESRTAKFAIEISCFRKLFAGSLRIAHGRARKHARAGFFDRPET